MLGGDGAEGIGRQPLLLSHVRLASDSGQGVASKRHIQAPVIQPGPECASEANLGTVIGAVQELHRPLHNHAVQRGVSYTVQVWTLAVEMVGVRLSL